MSTINEMDRNRPSESGRERDANLRDDSAVQPGISTVSDSDTDDANDDLTETASDDFTEDLDDDDADATFDKVGEDEADEDEM